MLDQGLGTCLQFSCTPRPAIMRSLYSSFDALCVQIMSWRIFHALHSDVKPTITSAVIGRSLSDMEVGERLGPPLPPESVTRHTGACSTEGL